MQRFSVVALVVLVLAIIELTLVHSAPCILNGYGDPMFTGFHGQVFNFKGFENGYFNIFSDPWININARFADPHATHAVHKPGHGSTIMSEMGVVVDGHTIGVVAKLQNTLDNACVMQIDGKQVTLNNTAEVGPLNLGCVQVSCSKDAVLISTVVMDVKIVLTGPSRLNFTTREGKRRSESLTNPSFNIQMQPHVAFENVDLLGGLLGLTAASAETPELDFQGYVSSSLFATDAKVNKYLARGVDCNNPLVARSLIKQMSARAELAKKLDTSDPNYVPGSCQVSNGTTLDLSKIDISAAVCVTSDVTQVTGFAYLSVLDDSISFSMTKEASAFFIKQPSYDVSTQTLLFELDPTKEGLVDIVLKWEYAGASFSRDLAVTHASVCAIPITSPLRSREQGETCTARIPGIQGNCADGSSCNSDGICAEDSIDARAAADSLSPRNYLVEATLALVALF